MDYFNCPPIIKFSIAIAILVTLAWLCLKRHKNTLNCCYCDNIIIKTFLVGGSIFVSIYLLIDSEFFDNRTIKFAFDQGTKTMVTIISFVFSILLVVITTLFLNVKNDVQDLIDKAKKDKKKQRKLTIESQKKDELSLAHSGAMFECLLKYIEIIKNKYWQAIVNDDDKAVKIESQKQQQYLALIHLLGDHLDDKELFKQKLSFIVNMSTKKDIKKDIKENLLQLKAYLNKLYTEDFFKDPEIKALLKDLLSR